MTTPLRLEQQLMQQIFQSCASQNDAPKCSGRQSWKVLPSPRCYQGCGLQSLTDVFSLPLDTSSLVHFLWCIVILLFISSYYLVFSFSKQMTLFLFRWSDLMVRKVFTPSLIHQTCQRSYHTTLSWSVEEDERSIIITRVRPQGSTRGKLTPFVSLSSISGYRCCLT